MKIVTWNLNSRTNLKTLNKQGEYLKKQNFDSMQEFNISTGYKYTVKEFCSLMGYKILKNERSVRKSLLFGVKPNDPDEIMDVYNDNSALLNLGWRPKFNLESGLDNMIANTKR